MNHIGFLFGTVFGFLLAGTRLNEYDVIHDMLLLREFDLWLLFLATIATAAPLLWLLQRRSWVTPLGGPLKVQRTRVERKNVLGAMVFGTGWAITGACPGTALAMPLAGTLPGLFVMAGLLAGVTVRNALEARWSAVNPASR